MPKAETAVAEWSPAVEVQRTMTLYSPFASSVLLHAMPCVASDSTTPEFQTGAQSVNWRMIVIW